MEISGNAFNAGLSGIQAGQRRVEQAASEIASSTVPAQQPAETPPQQQVSPGTETQGRNEVQAGARVVETADEVLGTLIDTRA